MPGVQLVIFPVRISPVLHFPVLHNRRGLPLLPSMVQPVVPWWSGLKMSGQPFIRVYIANQLARTAPGNHKLGDVIFPTGTRSGKQEIVG